MTLRETSCFELRRVLASCWVMVDPPCRISPLDALAWNARRIAFTSTGPCSQNRTSSVSTMAATSTGATWSNGTAVRSSPAWSTAATDPSAA